MNDLSIESIIKFIFALILISFLSCTISYAQSYERADQYRIQAQAAQKSELYLKAAQLYEKSILAEKDSSKVRNVNLILALDGAGLCYYTMNEYEKALKYFEEAFIIAKAFETDESIAMRFSNLGELSKSLGQYERAIKYYEESLSIFRKIKQDDNVVIILSFIGISYNDWGQYDSALKYYKEALSINKKNGAESEVVLNLNSIGSVYQSWGQYEKALKYYEEALTRSKKRDKEEEISVCLNNIGVVYNSWGQYDKALEYFESTFAINKKINNESGVSSSLINIGSVYSSWGQYDKSLKNYEEALTIERKLGRESGIATVLNNIGNVYKELEQYNKSLKYLEEALSINRRLGQEGAVAIRLSNIGGVYGALLQYGKALKTYEEALETFKKLGRTQDVAITLNNIGGAYQSLGLYEKALEYYADALIVTNQLGIVDVTAALLSNIGMVYCELKQYNAAINKLVGSLELKEKLRQTALGNARRDYLASQIHTYRFLISAYLRNKDYVNTFSAMESSRSKLFAERLAGSDATPTIPTIESIQRDITADTAIISFANSNWDTPALLIITKDTITATELNKDKLLNKLPLHYHASMSKLQSGQRGLKITSKLEEFGKTSKVDTAISLDDLINYYRIQLTDISSDINKGRRGLKIINKKIMTAKEVRLDRTLYDFLLKPIEKHLLGKKRLIIIPDGVLAYLPFEALTDEHDVYLVEKYSISYIQSMSIMNMLKKRIYPADRKPMLAFGGAIYDEVSYEAGIITNEKQLLALSKKVNDAMRSKYVLGVAYASLGMGKWDNLPGTLDEVKAISKVVNGAKAITGRDVSEGNVKQMSSSGKLATYKVLHFATHGIVVPELPELSAIVLSQLKNQPDGEDGYLRMGKIEELNLKADVVNLSACETGLGKIYGGEGVVGLTQSFLLAGANGLSASLWSVNDISTSKFMVALYDMVEKRSISYGDAITEIKREFIQGKFGAVYRSPYYWAPFVYYGKL